MKASGSSASMHASLKQSSVNYSSRGQNLEFSVMFGELPVHFALPRETKISELNKIIKNCDNIHKSYAPIDSEYACLQSKSKIEMIDYWLLGEDNTLEPFRNKEIFEVVYVPKVKEEGALRLIDFEFKRCLGKGGSCAVYLVRNRRTGYLFALKQISKFEQILRERKILEQLEPNPYTIYCHSAFQSERHLNFLTDYYPGGELFIHLTQDNLNSTNAKTCFCEILLCMEFLHQRNILYRDLKPENILVDIHGHLKIADFGLSRTGFKSQEFAESYCGSPEYMAPEMVMQTGYGFSLDFYTIGVLLYEFITGEPPYYTEDKQLLLHNITTQEIEYPEDIFEPDLKSLLERMLHKNPEKRICSFEEIKRSSWLKDVNWNKIGQQNSKPPLVLDLYSNYIHEQFYEQKVEGINKMNLMLSATSSDEVLFEFFKFQKTNSRQVLYGSSPPLTQRVTTSVSESEMKPTALKEPRTLKPNIKFGKNNHQPLTTLSDIKPLQPKKKITLVNFNNKRHSQKEKQNSNLTLATCQSNRNSASLLKQNLNTRQPIMLKPKKTPNNASTNNSRSKDQRAPVSLGKSQYRTLSKKTPSIKDLMQYQSEKRNSVVSVKSTYKIMLI